MDYPHPHPAESAYYPAVYRSRSRSPYRADRAIRPINPSADRPLNQPVNQSINQSADGQPPRRRRSYSRSRSRSSERYRRRRSRSRERYHRDDRYMGRPIDREKDDRLIDRYQKDDRMIDRYPKDDRYMGRPMERNDRYRERNDRRDPYDYPPRPHSPPRGRMDREEFPRRGGGAGGRPQNRPEAPPSNVLGLFGLGPTVTEEQVRALFPGNTDIEKVFVVMDRMTGQGKGLAFVNFQTTEQAVAAKASLGSEPMLHGRSIRLDFSKTLKPHDPTPGQYMGRPDQRSAAGSRSQGRDEHY